MNKRISIIFSTTVVVGLMLFYGHVVFAAFVSENNLSSTYNPETISVDEKNQQQNIVASDGEANDHMGYSVASSGDTAIVGAYLDDDMGIDAGSAYIYVQDGMGWSEQSKLLANDGSASSFFGYSVALSGNTAVVGAHRESTLGAEAGAAYVFVRHGCSWTQEAKLTANDGAAGDRFGVSVAISGDTIVVGAYRDDDKGFDSGSAYIFVREDGNWTQQAKINATDGSSLDTFGRTVSISEDTVLVGVMYDDDNGSNSGSAYIYERTGTTWNQQFKLLADDGVAFDQFGMNVSIDGNSLIVGADGVDDKADYAGSAYVFIRDSGGWSQQAKLLADDGGTGDRFGLAVSIHGDIAAVGSPFNDELGTDSGAAYLFERNGSVWSLHSKLTAFDGEAGDFLRHIAFAQNAILVGADGDDINGIDSGSVYSFDHPVFTQTIIYDPSTGLLPDKVSPGWEPVEVGTPEEPNIIDGKLVITTTQNADDLGYMQTDLILSFPFVIEARVKRVSGSSRSPAQAPISIGFTSEPNIGNTLYIGEDEIFIVDASLNVEDSAAVDTNGSFHDYRIEVDAAGSIQVFYDKTLTLSGTTFTSAAANGPVERIIWGDLSAEAHGVSEWEWIRHNATRTQLCDADVFVEKSVSHATALPGQPVTYTLNFGNNGPDIAFNTIITDALSSTIQDPGILSNGSIITQTGTNPFTWQVQDLAPGESGIITITGIISPDLETEMMITNTVEISDSWDVTLANNVATAVSQIVIPEISFSQSSYTVDESAGSLTITAVLSPAQPFMDVFVDYQTEDGTAVAGDDYTTVSGILTFLQGITQTTIAIPVLDDDIPELDKTFSLALSTPAHAILNNSTAAVTILDDDILPTESLVFLPMVLNLPAPLEPDLPIFIGESIASRPVTAIGEVFYTTTLNIPAALPETGQFFLSSQPEQLSQIVVDDELVILLDGAEVFAYTFSSADSPPKSAIVEIPRSVVELLAGQTGITVVYRDVFGYAVSASAIWFQYVP